MFGMKFSKTPIRSITRQEIDNEVAKLGTRENYWVIVALSS